MFFSSIDCNIGLLCILLLATFLLIPKEDSTMKPYYSLDQQDEEEHNKTILWLVCESLEIPSDRNTIFQLKLFLISILWIQLLT